MEVNSLRDLPLACGLPEMLRAHLLGSRMVHGFKYSCSQHDPRSLGAVEGVSRKRISIAGVCRNGVAGVSARLLCPFPSSIFFVLGFCAA